MNKFVTRIIFVFILMFVGLSATLTLHARLATEAHIQQHKVSQKNANAVTFVWPVSGEHNSTDAPFSSAYGPRLKASDSFRYDYHQGLDIPIPVNTTLVAVSTGTIRIAGSHHAYQDGVVQINHGDGLYSNYLHITASLVTTGQEVSMGEPVALSGRSLSDDDTGFPHLHFEIREGSVWRRDTVNPFNYLPYEDSLSHGVVLTAVSPGSHIGVSVTVIPAELDINQISVTVRNPISGNLIYSHHLNYEARNLFYNGDPSILDIPTLDNMVVHPQQFNTSSQQYEIFIRFNGVPDFTFAEIKSCVLDVGLNAVCIERGSFAFVLESGP